MKMQADMECVLGAADSIKSTPECRYFSQIFRHIQTRKFNALKNVNKSNLVGMRLIVILMYYVREEAVAVKANQCLFSSSQK